MKKLLLTLSILFLTFGITACETVENVFSDFVESIPGEIAEDLVLETSLNQQVVTYHYQGELLEGILPYPYFNKDTLITLQVSYKDLTVDKTILVKKSPIIHDLYITTLDGNDITSKEDYVAGFVSVEGSEAFNLSNQSMQIRGRGNSSWEYPKKPYRIKFDSRTSLLGMAKAKDYVLLAEYNDKSLIRNYMAHYMTGFLDTGHRLETRFVNLYLNGSYRGVYLLTEQIEVDKNRLNIDESDLASGGFLIELETEDRIWREGIENYNWFTVDNRYFLVKSPDVVDYPEAIVTSKITYMKTYLNDFLASIETDTYDTYIDTDNFIDYFILAEFFKQVDIGYSSVFAFKDLDQKLMMGPSWDFDISSGNGNYYDYTYQNYWVDYNPWFYKLIQKDSFEARFIARFNDIMNNHFDAFIAEIDYVSGQLYPHAIRNFEKWDILGIYVWPNPQEMVEANTYSKQISYLKTYLTMRKDWLQNELNDQGYYLD